MLSTSRGAAPALLSLFFPLEAVAQPAFSLNRSAAKVESEYSFFCGEYGSCNSCIEAGCLWCPTDNRCHREWLQGVCGINGNSINETDNCPAPAPKQTAFDMKLAREMTIYSYAAYYDDPVQSPVGWPSNSRVVGTFSGQLSNDDQIFGFGAVEDDRKRIVMGFRGTSTIIQLTSELSHHALIPLPYTNTGDALINEFFITAVELVWGDVVTVYENAHKSCGADCKLYVTGHSLGAALAAVVALHLVHRLPPPLHPILYTFGQPRVGNLATAQMMDAACPHYYRVVAGADPIPHVPLCDTGSYTSYGSPCEPTRTGYYHGGMEIWFPTGNFKNGALCGYRECVLTPKGEDWACSDGLNIITGNPLDHSKYWNVIAAGFCKGPNATTDSQEKVKVELPAIVV
eukprot:TRINITY_DN49750_c0_g1_i1.p1 TRINITY_DN49750_c0_g1~~TRINITY_DN49750_c0_g1_i1.p1  ORF type:complete len:401 (+),score=33.70 TRINITY_DN49750_c0_g1_i1:42-1244(+)